MKTEYHKIQSVYKRDPETKFKTLLEGEFSLPIFEYLKDNEWVFTEKVDGTNIRVILNEEDLKFGGRSDQAQLPGELLNRLSERFKEDVLRSYFEDGAVLYGEGYGPKIQKGDLYRSDQDFVLFDVRVGQWWLERSDVEQVAKNLKIDVVPIIGTGTIQDIVALCKEGFNSTWGDFESEGVVARPRVEMKMRNSDRVITKLKCRDFYHLKK